MKHRTMLLCATACLLLTRPVFADSFTMSFQRISLWQWDVQPSFDTLERLASIDVLIDWPVIISGFVRYNDTLGEGYNGSLSVSANMSASLVSSVVSQGFYAPYSTPDTLAVIPAGQTHANLWVSSTCVQHIDYLNSIPISGSSGGSGQLLPSFTLYLIPLSSELETLSWSSPIPGGASASFVEYEVPYLSDGGRGTVTYNFVPEPSTLALLGIGLLGLVGYGWRHSRN